jgi:Putative zinc-finger
MALMRWSCKKIELFINDYLEEKLSVQDKFTYEAHVETCPDCRKYVDDMSTFIEKVRGEIAPGVRERGQQMAEKMRQRVSDDLAELPMKKQLLLAEALGRDVEEDERRRKEWMEKVRRRRERAKPN